jgi:aminoglycoside phosphotransferase (APT) family kinase protein
MVRIDSAVIARVAALTGSDVADVARFADGVTNDTYKITFHAPRAPVVLRLYRDASRLQVEVAALSMVRGKVPVPALLHVVPVGEDGLPPFIVLEYIEGVPFREFRRQAEAAAVGDVAYQVGRALAAIHTLPPGTSGPVESRDGLFADHELGTSQLLRDRVGVELLQRVRSFVDPMGGELRALAGRQCFTHGDFNNRNVLVRWSGGRWNVAAIVDWECGGLGTPLGDVARFLQYETRANPSREPSFSRGYLDGGGSLPRQWWRLSRAMNLRVQCRLLSEETIPREIVHEVIALMQTTLHENASGYAAKTP